MMAFRGVATRLASILCATAFSGGLATGTASARPFLGTSPFRTLFVADQTHNAIALFPAGIVRPKQFAAITAGINVPVDVFVDAFGTLYVANVADTNPATVTEYAAGTSIPKLTLSLGRVHPVYLTVGPDGTVYVMTHNKYTRWMVLEFDAGARTPSRTIHLPYQYPYPDVGGGISVSKDNYLYMNEGAYNAGGGFAVEVFPPKATTPVKAFGVSNSGYAGGAIECLDDHIYVGDPYDNAVQIERLPFQAPFSIRDFATESSGDYLTVDLAANLLYSVSYGTNTLQIYDLRTGRLLNFLTGFKRGVAVDHAP